MRELYFIRHAESVMNPLSHLVGGRSNDIPLTEAGDEQAAYFGGMALKKGLHPDEVFVSPALRTLSTAYISLAAMGLLHKGIVIVDALQELSQGVFEGRLRKDAYTETTLQEIGRLGKNFKFEGGESMHEVGERVARWVHKAYLEDDSETLDVERHFVYTHGGTIQCFASHILGWSHEKTFRTPIRNTSVSLFTVQRGEIQVAYLDRHIDDV